jgi:hypothetical protein
MEPIAADNVLVGCGSSQDYGGDGFQALIALDASQNLAAVHSRHIQIEQRKVWAWGIGVGSLTIQESHGVHAIGGDVQTNAVVGGAEGFPCQPHITGTVFDQQNF